jgi:hypothetical protein
MDAQMQGKHLRCYNVHRRSKALEEVLIVSEPIS